MAKGMRTGRIVQLKKASNPSKRKKLELIEGTIKQDNFASDVSFEAPMELGDKLTLGTKVAFVPKPYRRGGRGVGERKVKITKILKG